MKNLLLALCFAFPALGFCQDDELAKDTAMAASFSYQPPKVETAWADFVKNNAHGFRGYADNYNDLEFLKPLLKDKRIVMLGESSYGVAEYESVKSRLAAFLVKEMGFEVIAFETGIAEASAANFDKTLSPVIMLKQALYKIWHTEQMLPAFKLAKSSNINIAGFDVNASGVGYANYLRQFFRIKNDSLADIAYTTDSLVADYSFRYQRDDFGGPVKKSFEREKGGYVKNYEKMIAAVEKLSPTIETKTIARVLRNRIILMDYFKLSLQDFNIAAEKTMADNITWLANTLYPGKKIIVWAHNLHIEKNTIQPVRMAVLLSPELKKQSYSVGIYAYKGVNASNVRTPFKIKRPDDNSLEAIMHKANYKYAFLDLASQTNNGSTEWMFKKTATYVFGIRQEDLIPKDQYDAIILSDKASMPSYINFNK